MFWQFWRINMLSFVFMMLLACTGKASDDSAGSADSAEVAE